LGVFALGFVTLFASKYLVAEDLYPWLGAVSGFMVLAIGAHLLVKRWQDWRAVSHEREHHDHDHNHDPSHEHHHDHDHTHLVPGSDGAPVSLRSLLGLGISGGLLPCPAALVLLLTAVSLQRTGLGLALVLAFSLGLAGVLTAVGLLFVKGGQLIDRVPHATAMTRFLPVLSSLAIALVGAVITVKSVSGILP
jgi:ABC-type nickel/cobalt efflux system permease component RcnA